LKKVGCLSENISHLTEFSNKYPLQRDIFCTELRSNVWPLGPCVELCSMMYGLSPGGALLQRLDEASLLGLEKGPQKGKAGWLYLVGPF
jgi:hypothetical protein